METNGGARDDLVVRRRRLSALPGRANGDLAHPFRVAKPSRAGSRIVSAMEMLSESLSSRPVYLLDVIAHSVVNRLAMLGVIPTNPLTAMLLQEGHTLLVPSRSGQFSRAVARSVQGIYRCATRNKKLNGPQVTSNGSRMERCSPIRTVRRCDAYAVREHRPDCTEVSGVGSVDKQVTGPWRRGHSTDEQPLPNAARHDQNPKQQHRQREGCPRRCISPSPLDKISDNHHERNRRPQDQEKRSQQQNGARPVRQ